VILLCPAGAGAQTSVSEVPLPGGIRSALAAIGDQLPPDRSQFLVEFIRRTYNTPVDRQDDPRGVSLRSLVAEVQAAAARDDSSETLPLPLSDRIWIEDVFGGQATPETLVSAILQSRNAALLYCGLLSLDDDTRAWFGGQRALVRELASRRAAAFLAAAPGLRVTAAGLHVPGGARATPVWEALVGRHPDKPADFVGALVAPADGHLAHFFGMIGQLTPPQVWVALNLASPEVSDRVDSARRLYSVFRRLSHGRTPEQHAFTRATIDPALLIAELEEDEGGRPLVPGTRGLWNAVFADGDERRTGPTRENTRVAPARETPADFPWLCERVFEGGPAERHNRYLMVLFASRRLGRTTPDDARDAIDSIRAVASYPALTTALERAGVADMATFASAARRATALSTIGDAGRAGRALAQFQGALALVTRAASRGSMAAGSVSTLVSSLSGLALSDRGEYEGRLVSWLSHWMTAEAAARKPPSRSSAPPAGSAEDEDAAGPLEQRVIRLLAGSGAIESRLVEWEGTRYRFDLAGADATRMARALDESPGPYLSSAVAVVGIAAAVADARLTRDGLRTQAQQLEGAVRAGGVNGRGASAAMLPDRHRDVAAALQRAAGAGDIRAASRLAPALRRLADDLLARGLMEMAYAAALGPRDGLSISAADAVGRHDFLLGQGHGRRAPWRLPTQGTDLAGRWRVAGSLLGLDVRLADFSLVSFSSTFPSRRPTLDEVGRRVFIEAVALVDPASLTDADRDRIANAIRTGRARLVAARTPREALTIAEEIRLSTLRRTLLTWTVTHDPGRVAAFLSPSELLWLGLGATRVDALRAWGAPAGSRQGCLCLQVLDRRPWESVAGRWNAGMMASAFPDLNLRLAELLSELHMPAALLGSVLTSATLNFVNAVVSRDPDDRRGLVEFVQALRIEHLEQYLALLTTDGPLVPIGAASAKDTDAPRPGRVPELISP
jgi:hypothetical protein